MTVEQLKVIIKRAVIYSISNFFERKIAQKDRKNEDGMFQILDVLMPKERQIRSVVGGLETSMGNTLWEPLAKEIALNNGFKIISGDLLAPAIMPASLVNTIQPIIEARTNNSKTYDAKSSHEAIKAICQTYLSTPIKDFTKAPRGFGVDIWLQKDGVDYLFDTKTVQPNIGSYSKFLTQLINWYAYYYAKNPNGKAEARIVFPYNPHKGDFWDKTIGGGKPLEKTTEGWVQDEFWDFISGFKGTFKVIREAFEEIYNEGTLERQLDLVFDRHKDDIKSKLDTDNM